MDWFKGKSTGNHGFYHQIKGFPVNFPIIQFYEMTKCFEVLLLSFTVMSPHPRGLGEKLPSADDPRLIS